MMLISGFIIFLQLVFLRNSGFLDTDYTLDQLKDLYKRSQFVYYGQLKRPVFSFSKHEKVKWLKTPKVIIPKNDKNPQKYVIFDKDNAFERLPKWKKEKEVLVFGSFDADDGEPHVAAVIDTKKISPQDFFSKLLTEMFGFKDEDLISKNKVSKQDSKSPETKPIIRATYKELESKNQ